MEHQRDTETNLTQVSEKSAPATKETTEDIELLKKQLEEEKSIAEKLLSNWQRTEADFSNFKKRSEQESVESVRYGISCFITNFLPVLDDFERASNTAARNIIRTDWWQGLNMVYQKFQTTLKNQGLEEIKAIGQSFDPHFHQAAGYAEGDEGKVVEVLQKGYMFQNRVLRASIVMVGKGITDKAEIQTENQESNQTKIPDNNQL